MSLAPIHGFLGALRVCDAPGVCQPYNSTPVVCTISQVFKDMFSVWWFGVLHLQSTPVWPYSEFYIFYQHHFWPYFCSCALLLCYSPASRPASGADNAT